MAKKILIAVVVIVILGSAVLYAVWWFGRDDMMGPEAQYDPNAAEKKIASQPSEEENLQAIQVDNLDAGLKDIDSELAK